MKVRCHHAACDGHSTMMAHQQTISCPQQQLPRLQALLPWWCSHRQFNSRRCRQQHDRAHCRQQQHRVCCLAAKASRPGRKLLLPEQQQVRRVMLKISGEALQGGMGFGTDPKVLQAVSREIAAAVLKGVQVAIVVGGGNYFRGANAWEGLERASADYVGMLATCMNALLLQAALEEVGVQTRVQTAIEMREIAEPFIRRRAIRHLERGRVVIFGAGTGNPYFTTDTAAALRAAEIEADAFYKATKVDGVYDSDPVKNSNAKLHKRLSYTDVMENGLQVMDETAITLCKENSIPVVVFSLLHPGNIMRALTGDFSVGTLVSVDEGDAEEILSTS